MIFFDSSSGAVICVGACGPVKKKKWKWRNNTNESDAFLPVCFSHAHTSSLTWVCCAECTNLLWSFWTAGYRSGYLNKDTQHQARRCTKDSMENGLRVAVGGYVLLSWNLRLLNQAVSVSNGSASLVIGQIAVKTDVHLCRASTAIPAWDSESGTGNLLCSHN